MGTGRSVGISSMLSRQLYGLSLSTNSPYFMGRRVTVGADMGISRQKNYARKKKLLESNDGNGYGQTTIGGGVSASYALGYGLVQSWSYRPSSETLNFLNNQTSRYLTENIAEHKTRFISTLGHQVAYTKNFFSGAVMGSNGLVISINNQFTGLGGSVRYMSNSIQGLYYYNLDEQGNYRVRLESKYQVMSKIGYVRFMDQFFVGGFAFPGFEDSGIGPRDLKTSDPLGGRNAYVVSAKLDFALPSPQDLPFKGCLHAHMGSLWNSIFAPIEGSPMGSQDFSNRVSIGVGVFTEVPMLGKIGIILSRALVKADCDQVNGFELVVSREF
jgi:outer membrane protein insertion porin family